MSRRNRKLCAALPVAQTFAHEAIIDKPLFERVQAKLYDRRPDKSGQSYRSQVRRTEDAYLLSGLVYCAHCGCKMHGNTLIAKGHRYPKYSCSTYVRSGKNNPHGCGCHGVPQDQLVDVLVRKLQECVLSSNNLERLRKALRQQIDQRRAGSPKDTADLRKQLADLDREVDRAAENFLRAPAEVLDLVSNKLTALKRQREHVQNALRAAQAVTKPMDAAGDVDAAVARFWRLGEELGKAEPARRREVIRLFVERIELRFDQVKQGKKVLCPLRSGEIHLRTGEGTMFFSVSRGDWI
jgi:site-specific DNA recombinase